jgi:hypothetical protein
VAIKNTIESRFLAETGLLGLVLLPGQEKTLLAAYTALREMVELVGADYPFETEPAHVVYAGAEQRGPEMTDGDPCFLSIAEAASLIAAKQISRRWS